MSTEYAYTCTTCDHAVTGRPVFHLGLAFCCAGCAADGPCMCSYDEDDASPSDTLTVAPVEVGAGDREPVTISEAVADDAKRLVGAGR